MGGFKTLQIAANRQSDLVGYISHCPATVLETANPIFTGGATFYSFNLSGLDTTSNQLNGVTIPGIVGYGTSDEAVGWSSSGVGSGSVGTSVASFTGAGTLSVSTVSNFVHGAAVQLTNLSGGTGVAIVQFTGISGGSLTGCKTVAGSGTITASTIVIQSTTDQMITNAQAASQPVTRYSTSDVHEFTSNDATKYSTWVNSQLRWPSDFVLTEFFARNQWDHQRLVGTRSLSTDTNAVNIELVVGKALPVTLGRSSAGWRLVDDRWRDASRIAVVLDVRT